MEAKLAKSSKNTLDSAKKSLKSFEAKQVVSDHKVKVRMRDNRLAIIVTAAVVFLSTGSQFLYFNFGPGVSPTACIHFTQTKFPSVDGKPNPAQIPDAAISQCRDWVGTLQINDSKMKIKLDGNKAPQATANFIKLATEDGFYNGVPCTRLTTSGIFVLQCGDNKGDGTGNPGYEFGPLENTPEAAKGATPTYKKGVIAMARSRDNDKSMGSQFFIVYADSKIPNDSKGGYTIFGEVTSGLSGLDSIIKAGTKNGSGDGAPKIPTSIQSITLK